MSFILPLNPIVHFGESDLLASRKQHGVTESNVSFQNFLILLQVSLPNNSSSASVQ